MQLRLVLIGAALLIAIFADLLALRIGQTEYRGQFPTKGHQVGHGRISAIDDFWVDNILIRIKMAASTPKMLLLLAAIARRLSTASRLVSIAGPPIASACMPGLESRPW